MPAGPSWPRAPVFVKTLRKKDIEYIGYPNLPILKHLIFSIRLVGKLRGRGECAIIQYNAFLFENITLLAVRKFIRPAKLGCILQDVLVRLEDKSLISVMRYKISTFSIKLIRKFDLAMVIAPKLVKDFKLFDSRSFVFKGGIVDTDRLLSSHYQDRAVSTVYGTRSSAVSVFAGVLEKYNGIDLLVEAWLKDEIQSTLYVYGDGSLFEHISSICVDTNVKVMGSVPIEEVNKALDAAAFAFCMRYSRGIDQEYFFPSKIFELLNRPIRILSNASFIVPRDISENIFVMEDDLSNLQEKMEEAALQDPLDVIAKRHSLLDNKYSWEVGTRKLLKLLEVA